MNAITPLPLPAADSWPTLWSQCNCWRGRAINEFARAEAVVSEALLQLAAVPERGSGIALPHLVGQRFALLARLVGEGGPFAVEGKGVAKALAEWGVDEPLRALLCHGVVTVTIDHRGCWHMVVRVMAFRAGKATRDIMVLDEEEAEARLKALHVRRQRLEGRLRSMMAGLKAA